MTDRPSFIDDMVGEGAVAVPTLTASGIVICYPYGRIIPRWGIEVSTSTMTPTRTRSSLLLVPFAM